VEEALKELKKKPSEADETIEEHSRREKEYFEF